jgi:AcrR family transcriptional regulator
MVVTAAPALDRRQRRRQETIEEVLDVAAAIMAEQGVAGLSIGEVARRMGIRPPSLYVYFESKHAIYDALFARGARLVLAEMQTVSPDAGQAATLEDGLLAAARTMVRWAVENPAYSQLLFWRPVPGYSPSPEAYLPAQQLIEASQGRFATLRDRGLLRDDVPIDVVLRDWTCLTAGVMSQQMANAPQEPFDDGTFTTALPRLVSMFAAHYAAPPSSTPPSSAPTPIPTRRTRRAVQR